jgi:hypothetical protein
VTLKLSLICIAFIGYANPVISQISNISECPDSADLDYGIVFTNPVRWGEAYQRYRRLEGPYIGINYINGIFPDGTTVSYSGLFTYKHWRKGEVTQYEEPQTDLTELLKFEVGSTHKYEGVRYDLQSPNRRWYLSTEYRIEAAEDFSIGGCSYAAVQISREGTITMPDGEIEQVQENYTFVPELLLNVSGDGSGWGDVSSVRKRSVLDGWTWPFSWYAAGVLDD